MTRLNRVTKICSIVCLTVFLASCGKTETSATQSPTVAEPQTSSTAVDLKVVNWGPQETKVGAVPNIQPDGNMGLWIQVSSTKGLRFEDVQVLFSGQPGDALGLQGNAVTVTIPKSLLATAGNKEVSIKLMNSQKALSVGTFKVTN